MPQSRPVVTTVSVDHDATGRFVARPEPRLAWMTGGGVVDWRQASAQVRLGDSVVTLEGSASVDIAWPFAPLTPRERVELAVRVAGVDGSTSEWSNPVEVVGGFLGPGEWSASWIAGGSQLRSTVELTREPRAATLYATARGVLTVTVNGERASDDVLSPGWTAYRDRIVHETWDVLPLLRPGANRLAIALAGGWYTESYGFGDEHAQYYGSTPSAALQLIVAYDDGGSDTFTTGDGWLASGDGPLVSSGIYAGESVDARRVGTWHPAVVVDGPVPEARVSPPVRRIEELAVREVLTTPSGATVLDFGQNLVGRVRFTSRGSAGDTITLHHAEVLDGGELALRPLRRAAATDRYTHGGAGPETWEPDFTFHGFRYVRVDGVADLDPADFTAIVVHSELRRTGTFDSSDALLSRLHENVVWSARGNMLSLPTDCPQRDERLGWTGDVQVFAPSAAFLFDCDRFLASWLRDLALEQQALGGIAPVVVPWVLDWAPTEVAAWGDAATVVPTVLHERFGDRGTLATAWPSMTAWAERLLARAGDAMVIEGGFQFGDWLDPTAPPDRPGDAATSADLVASAWLIRSLDLVADAAVVLGHDEVPWRDAAARAREGFRSRHVIGERLSSDAPTAYALAIEFRLVEHPAAFGERLRELVVAAGHRIATGFVGTPIILDALTATGHFDTAVELLLQRECPSWLYPVTQGATTVWERWDSMLPDGTINPGEMTSFNHYALGAVVDWMHRTLAGLAPAAPGYRELRIAPRVTARLTHARATLDTPYGPAASGWERLDGGSVRVTCTIPPNTTATVELPDGRTVRVGSGVHSWTS